jgi:hypothetical protein
MLKRLNFSKSGPTTLIPTTFYGVSALTSRRGVLLRARIIAHVWTYLVDLYENKQIVTAEIDLMPWTHHCRDCLDDFLPS